MSAPATRGSSAVPAPIPEDEEQRDSRDCSQPSEPLAVARDSIVQPIAHNEQAYSRNAIPAYSDESPTRSIGTPTFQLPSYSTSHSRNSSAGLHVRTDLAPSSRTSLNLSAVTGQLLTSDTPELRPYNPRSSPMSSYFSLHGSRSYDMAPNMLSPVSASLLASPALSAMIDLTPLPSPLFHGELSPRQSAHMRGLSRSSSVNMRRSSLEPFPSRSNSSASRNSPPKKKKSYGSLLPHAVEAQTANAQAGQRTRDTHGRNRSISEFVPETLQNIRQRVATFGSSALDSTEPRHVSENGTPPMQREEYLAAQRGLTQQRDPTKALPSPPPSNKSVTESEIEDDETPALPEEPGVEYFAIHSGPEKRLRKWRSVRQLGQGTFSKVILATSQRLPSGVVPVEQDLEPSKLVAVKIVEHGPAGGADEERIKHSLDREVEILKSVSHPSIVHLKAMEEVQNRTFLVLTYCTGGDLFELASERRDLLTANLVQRMFSELVGAVRYLHTHWIVHRDIKLENILVNMPADQLTSTALPHPQSHPSPIITLTDLGLSRRISPPPASPLLSTRCGSEDYAAPEILLGQPYDGRSTDAWALGVLLYALAEGRLPFDAPPGKPERSRNTHRIARCDWIWCRFGDQDGDWIGDSEDADAAQKEKAKEWEGARIVVEALLKKVRMGRKGLDVIETWPWVKDGIQVEGGLRRIEDDGSVLRG